MHKYWQNEGNTLCYKQLQSTSNVGCRKLTFFPAKEQQTHAADFQWTNEQEVSKNLPACK